MGSVNVNVTNNVPAFNRALLYGIKKETSKSANWAGNRLIMAGVEKLEKKDTGFLAKSITYNVKENAAGVHLKFGTNVKYAIFVHEGTKPHWPPKTAIDKWAKRKFKIRNKKVLDRVSFAIRRKIALFGTEANPFIADAVNSEFKGIVSRFNGIPGKVKKKLGVK